MALDSETPKSPPPVDLEIVVEVTKQGEMALKEVKIKCSDNGLPLQNEITKKNFMKVIKAAFKARFDNPNQKPAFPLDVDLSKDVLYEDFGGTGSGNLNMDEFDLD